MTNDELVEAIKGDLYTFDMREHMLSHNIGSGAPLLNPESAEYNRRILGAHALLIQYYLDQAYPTNNSGYEFDIEVRVRRKRIQ